MKGSSAARPSPGAAGLEAEGLLQTGLPLPLEMLVTWPLTDSQELPPSNDGQGVYLIVPTPAAAVAS